MNQAPKKIVMSHNDDITSTADTILWNKYTIRSEEFKSFLQKKEKLHRSQSLLLRRNPRDVCDTGTVNYTFLTMQDLCTARNLHKWTFKYLHTIGLVKYVTNEYRLYPLVENGEYIKLKFNASTPSSSTYARIYGFSMAYASTGCKLPVDPSKVVGQQIYLEIQVNNLLQLGTLEQAQHLEEMFYKINYLKNVNV